MSSSSRSEYASSGLRKGSRPSREPPLERASPDTLAPAHRSMIGSRRSAWMTLVMESLAASCVATDVLKQRGGPEMTMRSGRRSWKNCCSLRYRSESSGPGKPSSDRTSKRCCSSSSWSISRRPRSTRRFLSWRAAINAFLSGTLIDVRRRETRNRERT